VVCSGLISAYIDSKVNILPSLYCLMYSMTTMKKYKNYRVKCPLCGMMGYVSRFYNTYKFQVFEQNCLGRHKGFNFVPVFPDQDFMAEFREHMLTVVLDLASNGLLDMGWFKKELNRPVIPVVYHKNVYSEDFPVSHDLHKEDW